MGAVVRTVVVVLVGHDQSHTLLSLLSVASPSLVEAGSHDRNRRTT